MSLGRIRLKPKLLGLSTVRYSHHVPPKQVLLQTHLPSSLYGPYVWFSSNDSNNLENHSREEQEKKANLGSMIDTIKQTVPYIFTKSIPKEIVSPEVLLRICPTHFAEFNAYLPNIKGHVSYYTTCKTLQLIVTSVVLNPKVKLHIQSIRTSDSNPSDPNFKYHCVYPESTKIYVKWSTCPEGCFHLSTRDGEETSDTDSYHSTSDAKLGSHSWSRFDTSKIINNSEQVDSGQTKALPSMKSFAQLTTGLIGLTKQEKKLERRISGLFIFELNQDNSQVIVHTIEDVDVIERTEVEDVDGKLRVC